MYPEHRKLREIKDKSQCIGEFIEWLNEEGMTVCEWSPGNIDNWNPTSTSTNRLLARFFEIDLDKLEEEKLAMLDECYYSTDSKS